ncbi:hypothetical protein GCM10010172_07220 [Paractinoplanes ferrugineus]|uniref:Uncharacterized protein n=1 Tax=Paractinoplanes ferrugineus TaxID=113564 RepID=A0A919JB34_9ACTN|nr:hypothetical protein [Actinoplanes ferrugineus]GIE16799.1 hypothetical protein Afe05nite_86390 [Actinoplanes ferrugineus]
MMRTYLTVEYGVSSSYGHISSDAAFTTAAHAAFGDWLAGKAEVGLPLGSGQTLPIPAAQIRSFELRVVA